MLMRLSSRCVVFNNACVDRFILCGDDHQAFQVSRAQLMMSTFNWSLNKQSIDIAVIELCRISCRVGDCVRAEYSYKQV